MVIGHLIKREGVDGEGDAVKLAAKNTAQWSRNQKIFKKGLDGPIIIWDIDQCRIAL